MTLSMAAPGMDLPPQRRAVAAWLLLVYALIFVMVLVGGMTRLTDSGLSIVEWKPVTGIVPPLSQADWDGEFAKYKASPQYQLQNHGMALDEFKAIYWWEWSHRAFGRLIGFAFAVPLLIFWVRGAIDRSLGLRLVGILVLGGMQGALGWFMVASGLVDRVSVAPTRLAAHLGLAVLLQALVLWTAMDVAGSTRRRGRGREALWAWAFAGFVFLQMISGALVAGMDAGLVYTTWPLMDGRLLPLDLMDDPHAALQLVHRLMAYVAVAGGVAFGIAIWRRHPWGRAHQLGIAIAVMVLVQAGIGIATLLHAVPLPLGVLHQAGALVLFSLAIAALHALTGPKSA
ncbi:COX15/CtaA family protein [Zavarzinia sp. CC-PAN008]|uniref:COX15/CtaA family protein n=1 Tax=Zavarzinia sp. CC-PAN008 TaxID=3243332 RepID=UPI003F745EB2